MTDPNVLKVLRNIVEALVVLTPSGSVLPEVLAALLRWLDSRRDAGDIR